MTMEIWANCCNTSGQVCVCVGYQGQFFRAVLACHKDEDCSEVFAYLNFPPETMSWIGSPLMSYLIIFNHTCFTIVEFNSYRRSLTFGQNCHNLGKNCGRTDRYLMIIYRIKNTIPVWLKYGCEKKIDG